MKGDRFSYRKIVNKDVTDPYVLEDLVDELTPTEGIQAKRSSMRTRYSKDGTSPMVEWYSDLGHGRDKYDEMYNRIEGLIGKYVGRSYNDAYSEATARGLLSEQYYMYGFGTGKDIWKQLFDKHIGDFGVENGTIYRTRPRAPRAKDIVVHNWREEPVYIVKKEYWEAARQVLLSILGWEAYYSYINKGIISEDAFNRLVKHLNTYAPDLEERLMTIRKFKEHKGPWLLFDDCPRIWRMLFEKSTIESTTVYKYGSKAYWEYRKQQRQAKKRNARARRNPDRSEYDKTLKERKNEFKLVE